MQLYATLVFVHVLAAVVLVGSSFLFPFTRAALRGAGTVEELRGWLRFAGRLAAVDPICALGVLATGVYLGSQGWWTYPWFWVAVGLFLINGGLAARALHGAAGELEAGANAAGRGPVPERIDALRWSARFDVPGDVLLANDVSLLFIMITKPGLPGSLATVALANGVLALVRRRRRAARPIAYPGGASAPAAAA